MGKDYISDEEFEQVTDEIIKACGKIIMEDLAVSSVTDFIRYKQVMFTYKALEKMLEGQKAKVTYQLHEPFHSVGVVTITGKEFKFDKPELFVKLCRLASNIDTYAKVDGTIVTDLTFHGLTKKI